MCFVRRLLGLSGELKHEHGLQYTDKPYSSLLSNPHCPLSSLCKKLSFAVRNLAVKTGVRTPTMRVWTEVWMVNSPAKVQQYKKFPKPNKQQW